MARRLPVRHQRNRNRKARSSLDLASKMAALFEMTIKEIFDPATDTTSSAIESCTMQEV